MQFSWITRHFLQRVRKHVGDISVFFTRTTDDENFWGKCLASEYPIYSPPLLRRETADVSSFSFPCLSQHLMPYWDELWEYDTTGTLLRGRSSPDFLYLRKSPPAHRLPPPPTPFQRDTPRADRNHEDARRHAVSRERPGPEKKNDTKKVRSSTVFALAVPTRAVISTFTLENEIKYVVHRFFPRVPCRASSPPCNAPASRVVSCAVFVFLLRFPTRVADTDADTDAVACAQRKPVHILGRPRDTRRLNAHTAP